MMARSTIAPRQRPDTLMQLSRSSILEVHLVPHGRAIHLAQSGHAGRVDRCPLSGGGFNRSAQHLLILRGEEVCHGDVADLVHGSAEGRAVGAMEEWAKCCGHLAGVGKEEQDWR